MNKISKILLGLLLFRMVASDVYAMQKQSEELDTVDAQTFIPDEIIAEICIKIIIVGNPKKLIKTIKKLATMNCINRRMRNFLTTNVLSQILKLSGTENVNGVNRSNGRTALHYAGASGELKVIEILILAESDVNKCNNAGQTALHLAIQGGHANCIEIFLVAGADINKTMSNGQTVLQIAAFFGHVNCVETLLRLGSNIVGNIDVRQALLTTIEEAQMSFQGIERYKACAQELVNHCARKGIEIPADLVLQLRGISIII
jgi:hypothetical protein